MTHSLNLPGRPGNFDFIYLGVIAKANVKQTQALKKVAGLAVLDFGVDVVSGCAASIRLGPDERDY